MRRPFEIYGKRILLFVFLIFTLLGVDDFLRQVLREPFRSGQRPS